MARESDGTVTERLARFVVETSYEDLPREAIALAKQAILDTVGVALAGAHEECSRIARDLVSEYARPDGMPMFGTGARAPLAEAVFANGVATHALDYDDSHYGTGPTRLHPSGPIVPLVLGLGQKQGASGAQVLTAYVIGIEVIGKVMNGLGRSHYGRGWHATSTIGILGAAAAAGKLLGLSERQMAIAFGIAVSSAAGTKQNLGTMTKPLHTAMAGRNGLLAASLAARGFTADLAIFDTRLGYGHMYAADGDWMPERVSNFGNPWEVVDPGLRIKRYSCCGGTHKTLDALLLEILPKFPVKAEDVDRVEARVAEAGLGQALIHSRPKTGLQGKFSMEYCMAAALLDGDIRLGTFTDEMVLRPEAQDLLQRVSVLPHHDAQDYGEVTLLLKDGSRRSARVEHIYGSPKNPMTWELVERKYRDCAGMALPVEKVAESLALISRLEELSEVVALTECLAVPDVVHA